MAPSYGSYKSTGVGAQTPPSRVSPDGQTTPRRREKVSRIVPQRPTPALSHVSRPVSLSLSPFVGGRRRCTRRARRLRGAVGVVCRRRGGRAWDGAWSSNRSAAQATPTHPNDAKASPSPSAGRRDAKQWKDGLFSEEVETIQLKK